MKQEEIKPKLLDLSKYLNWLHLSPKYLWPLFLAACVMLFYPRLCNEIGLTQFISKFRGYIGVVLLLSFLLLLSNYSALLFNKISKWFKRRSLLKAGKRYLSLLTPFEKEIMAEYLMQNTRTIDQNMTDGIVIGLEQAGLIYRSTTLSYQGTVFCYNIQPWVWYYLNKKPEKVLSELNLKKFNKRK
jgi:hypothetical protein